MEKNDLISLLQELIYARGPCGQEDEVREVCQRELRKSCDDVWTDDASNLVGLMKGSTADERHSPIRVFSHMDEISMMVKRVNSTGTLNVIQLGGLWPGNIGQVPVDILADSGIISGILSFGPMHVSREKPQSKEIKNIDWDNVWVMTRKTPDELKKLGVHPGTRVVIAKCHRRLFDMGDCVGGYYMDDRGGIAIAIGAADTLRSSGRKPARDTYFVMTTNEEVNCSGASYASRNLPGNMNIALDVGPTAEEYGTQLNSEPIIIYGDSSGPYTKRIADRLIKLGRNLGMEPQTASLAGYGSDASISGKYGQAARTALITFPTENTHGFEVICPDSLLKCEGLLVEFLNSPEEN